MISNIPVSISEYRRRRRKRRHNTESFYKRTHFKADRVKRRFEREVLTSEKKSLYGGSEISTNFDLSEGDP